MLPTSRRIRRMLLAYAVNEFGTWLGYVVLAVAVYDHTHDAFAVAGLFIARALLPALLAPVLVVRMERVSGRGALTALYVAEGLLTVALAALIWHFWLPGVLMLVALDGVAAIAAIALVRAAGTRIAEREREGEVAKRQMIASLNVVQMSAFAVGPAIGGALLASIGGPSTLLLDAASFLICGAILLDVRTALPDEPSASIRSRLAEARRHVEGLPALRTLMIVQALALALIAASEPIDVIFAKRTLAAGSVGYGVLLAFFGAGGALGAVVFARLPRRELRGMLTLGTLLVGLAFLGLAAAPSIAVACVAALVFGIGNAIQWPAAISAVQRLTPSALQGRMMGAIGSFSALFSNVGFAFGGTLVALSSTRIALLTAGLLTTATTLAFARLTLLPPPPPAPAAQEDRQTTAAEAATLPTGAEAATLPTGAEAATLPTGAEAATGTVPAP